MGIKETDGQGKSKKRLDELIDRIARKAKEKCEEKKRMGNGSNELGGDELQKYFERGCKYYQTFTCQYKGCNTNVLHCQSTNPKETQEYVDTISRKVKSSDTIPS